MIREFKERAIEIFAGTAFVIGVLIFTLIGILAYANVIYIPHNPVLP